MTSEELRDILYRMPKNTIMSIKSITPGEGVGSMMLAGTSDKGAVVTFISLDDPPAPQPEAE